MELRYYFTDVSGFLEKIVLGANNFHTRDFDGRQAANKDVQAVDQDRSNDSRCRYGLLTNGTTGNIYIDDLSILIEQMGKCKKCTHGMS